MIPRWPGGLTKAERENRTSHAKVKYGANSAYTLARLRRDDPALADKVQYGTAGAYTSPACGVNLGTRLPELTLEVRGAGRHLFPQPADVGQTS
jgi:hypothetical protein